MNDAVQPLLERTLHWACAVLLTFSLCAAGETLSQALERANELYQAGKPAEAAVIYQELLEKKPLPDLLMNLGHCFFRMGKYENAAARYREALKLKPDIQQGNWFLAQALFGAGHYDASIQSFAKTFGSQPEAFFWVGQCYERLRDYAAAEESYRMAMIRSPGRVDVRKALAALYMRLGRYEDARVVYEGLLRLKPRDEEVKRAAAKAKALPLASAAAEAYQDGLYARAARLYRAALTASPEAELYVNLGHALLRGGDAGAAAVAYGKALELKPRAKGIVLYLGRALFEDRQYEKCIAPLKRALEEGGKDEVALMLGRAYEALGRDSDAEQVYRRAAGTEYRGEHAANGLAALYARQEKYDQVVEIFRELYARHPGKKNYENKLKNAQAAAYAQKGNKAVERGNLQDALDNYLASVQLVPRSEVYSNIGHIRREKKEYKRAVEAYLTALELNPKRSDLYWPLAQASFEARDYKGAVAYALKAIAHNPSEEAFLVLGESYKEQQDVGLACVAYEMGCLRFPSSERLRKALAGAYVEIGESRRAEIILESLTRKRPGDAELLKLLAEVQLMRGDQERAIESLEMVVRLAPQSPAAYQTLADLYLGKEMYREAAQVYSRLISLSRTPSPEDLFRLAYTYFQAREWVSAKGAAEKAIKLKPTQARYHLLLGHIYYKEGKQDDALKSYLVAIKHDKKLAAAYLSLADIYSARGDYQAAAKHYLAAINAGAAKPGTFRNAIIALVNAKELLKAEAVYREALKRFPGHEDLADIRSLIQHNE